jgi:hypothetical protein
MSSVPRPSFVASVFNVFLSLNSSNEVLVRTLKCFH